PARPSPPPTGGRRASAATRQTPCPRAGFAARALGRARLDALALALCQAFLLALEQVERRGVVLVAAEGPQPRPARAMAKLRRAVALARGTTAAQAEAVTVLVLGRRQLGCALEAPLAQIPMVLHGISQRGLDVRVIGQAGLEHGHERAH